MNYWVIPGVKMKKVKKKILLIETLVEMICEESNISFEVIKGKERTQDIRLTRHIIMFFAYRDCRPQLTLESIGKFINRDHATVLYGKKIIANEKDHDYNTRQLFNRIELLINNYMYE